MKAAVKFLRGVSKKSNFAHGKKWSGKKIAEGLLKDRECLQEAGVGKDSFPTEAVVAKAINRRKKDLPAF